MSQSVSNGVVRLQFQPANQKPVFVAINGVAGSPSHQQWELLVNDGRYGDTDFSAELRNYRAMIDSVQPPRPTLAEARSTEGWFLFGLTSVPGARLEIEGSLDLVSWTYLLTVTNQTGKASFAQPAEGAFQFYRALQTPSAP